MGETEKCVVNLEHVNGDLYVTGEGTVVRFSSYQVNIDKVNKTTTFLSNESFRGLLGWLIEKKVIQLQGNPNKNQLTQKEFDDLNRSNLTFRHLNKSRNTDIRILKHDITELQSDIKKIAADRDRLKRLSIGQEVRLNSYRHQWNFDQTAEDCVVLADKSVKELIESRKAHAETKEKYSKARKQIRDNNISPVNKKSFERVVEENNKLKLSVRDLKEARKEIKMLKDRLNRIEEIANP